MPVTVVVRTASGPDRDAPSLTFDGARVVIGRGVGSDVRLPDPSVSTRHATIRATSNDYAIVDEGSTNGTWVGGVRLIPQSPRIVKSGDMVRVGRVWLELGFGQKAPTPDLGLATRDLAFALVQRAMNAVGDDTIARVRVAEGPDIGEELRLTDEGRAYVIGRADTCDLPLADADASREHALVARRGGQILLRDLGSRNGVFLGEQRLPPHRDVVWRPPMMARLGLSVLALDEPVSAALAELEAATDEAMREEDAPPPPSPPREQSAQSLPSEGVISVGARARAELHGPPSMPRSVAAPSMGGAPIAQLSPETSSMARVPQTRRGWTATDILVVGLAVGIILVSLAGLVWVLR